MTTAKNEVFIELYHEKCYLVGWGSVNETLLGEKFLRRKHAFIWNRDRYLIILLFLMSCISSLS